MSSVVITSIAPLVNKPKFWRVEGKVNGIAIAHIFTAGLFAGKTAAQQQTIATDYLGRVAKRKLKTRAIMEK